MKLPKSFLEFTDFFDQDVDTSFETPEELVHIALYGLTPAGRQELKDFMSELLSGKYDETQLREIWLKSKAQVLPFWGDEGSCMECLQYFQGLIEKDEPTTRE